MPVISERTKLDQDLLNLDDGSEEQPRKRSPVRRSQGRNRRRNEKTGQTLEETNTHTSATQELNSPPSLLSQQHNPIYTPQVDLTSNLDPSLEAYSDSTREQRSSSPKDSTADWARKVPYGRSPPHGRAIGLAGSPTQYEGSRGGFGHASPPTSPRNAYRQPYHRKPEYQAFSGLSGASPPNARPPSMYSTNTQHPTLVNRPPAHSFASRDVEFGIARANAGKVLPRGRQCYVFDTLSSPGPNNPSTEQDVLLVGCDCGLDIYNVNKSHFVPIGYLSGLRGQVIGATTLPYFPAESMKASMHPLVAVVVHGLYQPTSVEIGHDTQEHTHDEFEPSESMLQALEDVDIQYYQTTVDIYSLSKGEYITTLYSSPKIEVSQPLAYGAEANAPPPVGGLYVQAQGKFVIISSGVSGEVFVFERLSSSKDLENSGFRCIGKTWTKISSKQIRSMSVSSRESGHVSEDDDRETPAGLPILSLSARWLAVSSPASSSQTSIHGRVGMTQGRKFPGESTHASLAEPPITCELDMPEAESLLNRMARDATQEFVKGARWVGKQGLQAWSRYWAKPTEPSATLPNLSPPRSHTTNPSAQHFPPTHAQEHTGGRTKTSPALVSVIDLDKLSQSQHLKEANALQPIATFTIPGGCSIMSFAPTGLLLFTASTKADIQQVWDLTRVIHGEISRLADIIKGPSIREVARFTRMTEARLVDIAWTTPNGRKLAVVSDNGTVHAYSLPSTAAVWPPVRKVQPSAKNVGGDGRSTSQEPASAQPESSRGSINSTFEMLTGKTNAGAGSSFAALGGFASQASAQTGRTVAASINRSFTAAATGTVNTLRHLGENRISLPGSSRSVGVGCISWFSQRAGDELSLAVTGSGYIRVYTIRQSHHSKATKRRPSTLGSKPSEYSIPKRHRGQSGAMQGPPSPGSFWRALEDRPNSRGPQQSVHPLSHAEIETHAPYQPFHTDGRVNFFIYDGEKIQQSRGYEADGAPWVFGDEIAATRVGLGSNANEADESNADGGLIGQMDNISKDEGNGNVQDEQQILVTTRRKRQRKVDAAANENGDFFEDDLEFVDFAHERV
ncbi:uncharacterized protein KY384_008267 [Bacidia gigantensis]|uniref:uncharacterized protein n=1 Tax=Bacidia gigantensis TaxID=2732470 RepID=UPI001D0532FD|nr:uncharacterized protein KY384_008267 [Bacidia gigantensis]KAG8526838.1 hypothetical protein KY384_008267 [Bacidia gigantensis]